MTAVDQPDCGVREQSRDGEVDVAEVIPHEVAEGAAAAIRVTADSRPDIGQS